MKNILLTSAGKRVGLTESFKETVRQLGLDSRVYATDMNPVMAPVAYVADRCFKIRPVTAVGYIEDLLSLCMEEKIGIVIPTIDTELKVLAQNRRLFKDNGIDIVVSDYEFINICRDKHLTINLFRKLGIATPEIISGDKPRFPLFARLIDGSCSKGAFKAVSVDDISSEILKSKNYIFTEYVSPEEFKEYTVDLYFGKDNNIKCIVPRERLEIRAGEINKGITRRNVLVPFIKEHLRYLEGVRGCICVQLFLNESNEKILGIEINPRFGGGYPLSYKAGANYPEMLVKEYLLGLDLDYTEEWSSDLLMLRYDDAIYRQL